MRLTSSLLAVLAFAVVSAHPAPALAKFIFNGAGEEGGIVWDGGFDGSTSNSACSFDGSLCSSLQLTASTDVQALEIVLSGGSDTLSILDIYMLFSAPAGTVDCTQFLNCGTLSDLDSLSPDVFKTSEVDPNDPNLRFVDPNYINEVGDSNLTPAVGTRQIIAIKTSLDPNDPTLTHYVLPVLPVGFWDGFTGSFGDVFVGLIAHFDDPSFDNVPFTLDIVDPNAAPAPVPEPASMLLLGSGLAGLAARRYRRRHSQS